MAAYSNYEKGGARVEKFMMFVYRRGRSDYEVRRLFYELAYYFTSLCLAMTLKLLGSFFQEILTEVQSHLRGMLLGVILQPTIE